MGESENHYDAWLRRNPSHPGRHIYHGWMEAVEGVSEGVSVVAAAQKLGLSRTALSRVLNGHVGISVVLALKLEAAGWGTAEMWVRMQANYDLVRERRRIGQWPGGAIYPEESKLANEAA